MIQLSIADEFEPKSDVENKEKLMTEDEIDEEFIYHALPKIAKLYQKAKDGKICYESYCIQQSIIDLSDSCQCCEKRQTLPNWCQDQHGCVSDGIFVM